MEIYPIMTGSFSFSASSKEVCGATRGSGIHSSTRSSISCSHQVSNCDHLGATSRAHLFRKGHKVPIMGRIRGCEEVPHEEYNQDELNGRTDGVVLVAGLDVADEHGRAWEFLEGMADLVDST